MDWLSKIVLAWLSLDILIIAASCLALATIKPRWPEWWRRVIADELPLGSSQLPVVRCQLPNTTDNGPLTVNHEPTSQVVFSP